MSAASTDVARILTVCTGNICRSPLAEALLAKELKGLPVAVESAGTGAIDGDRATAETIELGRRFGAPEVEDHLARYLTEEILEDVDLVLTMTRVHTEAVLRLAPALSKRTFTIREFADLAETANLKEIASIGRAGKDPAEQLRALAAELSNHRGEIGDKQSQLDVSDPYRRGSAAYEHTAEELSPAVRTAVAAIAASLGGD
ncbi:MAG: low molecular weight phosphatase family protein [Cryobacterium sp.]|nr:low molecular weight phosphatase family protein [Cryobacterium sp.]